MLLDVHLLISLCYPAIHCLVTFDFPFISALFVNQTLCLCVSIGLCLYLCFMPTYVTIVFLYKDGLAKWNHLLRLISISFLCQLSLNFLKKGFLKVCCLMLSRQKLMEPQRFHYMDKTDLIFHTIPCLLHHPKI